MCAVDEAEGSPVIHLDEGSSSLSSIAEDEEVSDAEKSKSRPVPVLDNQVKMMCYYGGRILPQPGDGELKYVGGDIRIKGVSKRILYRDLVAKLSSLTSMTNLLVKYQLPDEDLDALVSVTSDEDVRNMVEEYEKMEGRSHAPGAVKLRVFLFPATGACVPNGNPFLVDSSSCSDEEQRSPPIRRTRSLTANIPRHPHEGIGSLKAYHHLHHDQQQQQQHPQQDEFAKARAAFLHKSEVQHLHQPVEKCSCLVNQCKSCWEWEQQQFSPRHRPISHQVSHIGQRVNSLHRHHPQYHNNPPQYQPSFGYEQHEPQKMFKARPEFRPELKPPAGNKFSFDHSYYKQHPQQQPVLHR